MKQSHPGGAGQIAASLLKFSLPLILSGILQQLYNWVDAFVVGNINGELALAAVGATSTVVNFYVTALPALPWASQSCSRRNSAAGIPSRSPGFYPPSLLCWERFSRFSRRRALC